MESTSRFDRFEILAPLGAGGMGEVVKARALGPHGFEKIVAIKRIRAEWSEQETMAERFIREARIAARLQHANIVQVFDFGRHDDELFIVMEFVDGQGLDAILATLERDGRRPTLAQTLQIALDVARALDAAHNLVDDDGEPSGIIHRDVSPANILVSRTGVVKLTDFGIAGWASREGRTSLVAGKPLYMAPEQLRGDALDGRADLFAAGLVLYELLTGERPWPGIVDTSPDATLESMGYAPPSTHVTGIPPELDALVARLLEPKADDRARSARELTKEILQISYRSQIVLDPSELSPLVGDRSEQATAPTLPQYVSRVQTLVASGVSPDGVTMLKTADDDAHTTEPGASTPERPVPASGTAPARGGSWLMGVAAVLIGLGAASMFLFVNPRGGDEPVTVAAATDDAPRPGTTGATETTETTGAMLPPDAPSADPPPDDDVDVAAEVDGDALAANDPGATPPEHGEEASEPEDARPDRVTSTATTAARPPREPRPPAGEQTARAEPPGPAVPAGATGRLDVFSRPWAQIFIDGQRRPENAPARGLVVPAGRHRVRLVNPVLGLSQEHVVNVPADGSAQLRVYLDGSAEATAPAE